MLFLIKNLQFCEKKNIQKRQSNDPQIFCDKRQMIYG